MCVRKQYMSQLLILPSSFIYIAAICRFQKNATAPTITGRVLYSGSGREKWCLIRLWQKLHLEILQIIAGAGRERVDRIKLSKVYWLLCFAHQYIGSKSTMYKQDILSLSFTTPILWAEFRKLNLQSLSHNLCIQIQTNLVCLRTFQETF